MKLSIITVNYNNKEGLLKTFNSIRQQTWHDYEWIVVDGGSTDGSQLFVEQYRHCMSYACSEKDNGVYNAMNKGITHSKGEYLFFLNSGDCFANDSVLENVFSRNTNSDVLYGYVGIQKEYGIKPLDYYVPRVLTARFFFDFTLPHQATFIRKTLFDDFGLYDETLKLTSDWKFFFKSIVLGNAITEYVPLMISIYDTEGMSSKLSNLVYKERTAVLSELVPRLIRKDYDSVFSLAEVQKYKLSKILYSILYRCVIFYQSKFAEHKFTI